MSLAIGIGISSISTKAPIIVGQASPGRSFTSPAATFTSLSTANNSGKLQLTSAGVHGLTSASVGRYVNISSGTNWTTGIYPILTVDSTTAVTLDLTYSAGLGAPVMTVAGTHFVVVSHAITAGLLGSNGVVDSVCVVSCTNSTNSKSHTLRLGCVLGGALGSGPSWGIATTGHVAGRSYYSITNTAYNAQIFGGASAVNTYTYGSSSSANSTSSVDTSVSVNAGLSVAVAVADEFIKLESYLIRAYPGQ